MAGTNARGHAGLTLALFSLLMIPFGPDPSLIVVIGVAAGVSHLLDYDIKWRIGHRGLTHIVFFSLGVGAFFGVLFSLVGDLEMAVLAFLGSSGGLLSHILGDMVVGQRRGGGAWKLRPLRPLSDREFGWGWFRSGDKNVNAFFLLLGCASFVACALV